MRSVLTRTGTQLAPGVSGSLGCLSQFLRVVYLSVPPMGAMILARGRQVQARRRRSEWRREELTSARGRGIATVAEREPVTVLHYDSDYELIAKISGQPAMGRPRGTVP
jgi:hypothetical protein